ncbi:phytase [Pontixanthobacter aquaemixtae]|uniref:Phytase n=1 Tax=Pontixanthobacter aquaemixtae TaxID=1958940 RepID=A0A844ZXB2_9SPHN|nr:phytase [Pontixanthobacter aquaemixtae]MXO91872.1 phytase [Pontixanthobacter aquaemixtae]
MRIHFTGMAALAASLTASLGGCGAPMVMGDPAVSVTALAETVPVGTANDDAADDPAIWRNADNPEASFIVATDKKAGLYVYNLDGKIMDFNPGGLLNNVDLLDLGALGVVVAASDRTDPLQSRVALYRLDTKAGKLQSIGSIASGAGEAYGLCMSAKAGGQSVFAVLKDGTIREYSLDNLGGPNPQPSGPLLREFSVPTQPEGCVVDPRNGTLYIGEENAGIWRFADGATTGQLVAAIDNKQLVADVEGLAIALDGKDGGWLIASSQGDNSYARYRLPDMEPTGRFRIAAGAYGATEETDGIALHTGNFGARFPGGVFVAQDGKNEPSAQNFKLVSWQDVEKALDTWKKPTP